MFGVLAAFEYWLERYQILIGAIIVSAAILSNYRQARDQKARQDAVTLALATSELQHYLEEVDRWVHAQLALATRAEHPEDPFKFLVHLYGDELPSFRSAHTREALMRAALEAIPEHAARLSSVIDDIRTVNNLKREEDDEHWARNAGHKDPDPAYVRANEAAYRLIVDGRVTLLRDTLRSRR